MLEGTTFDLCLVPMLAKACPLCGNVESKVVKDEMVCPVVGGQNFGDITPGCALILGKKALSTSLLMRIIYKDIKDILQHGRTCKLCILLTTYSTSVCKSVNMLIKSCLLKIA